MNILNQFSYVLFAGLLTLGMAVALWRWQRPPLVARVGLLAVIVLAAVLVGASRRYPTTEVTTLAEADVILSNEQATFVMLYSNY